MTTQPDIDAIARGAAEACSTCDLAIIPSGAAQEKRTAIIGAAILRALRPLEQENKDMAKAMALKTKLEHHLSEALSERDAAVNGMLDLKRTNQMLGEQLQKHAEAIEVLKSVEWQRDVDGAAVCADCRETRRHGHSTDCKLAKAIGK